MATITFTSAAVAVVSHERKSFRTEVQYDFLAKTLNLTPDTSSEDLTAAARSVVIHGAANDGTATGANITADDLTGRDPGNGSKVREYWKAARAVRIGLVKAVKRAAGDDGDDESATDYLARIVKAVEAGRKHDLTPDQIMEAVKAHLA
jgi:hypothetical protein